MSMEHLTKVVERAKKMGEEEVEILTNYDGEPYLSFPAGYRVAVDVERDQRGLYAVTLLAWDATGGISAEEEKGIYPNSLSTARCVVQTLREIREADARMEAALETYREIPTLDEED